MPTPPAVSPLPLDRPVKRRRNPFRRATFFALALLALGTSAPAALADAPNMVSGSGITVGAWRWITARTLEVDISTAKVSANAVNGPHRVRITFPNGYATSGTTRYPVLYLMHGGAGGNSAQWTTGGGVEEAITAPYQVITVMPDGGKVGWFTNWVNQAAGAQAWKDFHISQLIPWIDANLRTVASKSGRAIAGLSMGGFGAIRYAQDRPDLFAYAASFSGAVDLNDYGTRSVIGQQATQNGYSPSDPFGNPFPPFDSGYRNVDPVTRAARLSGVGVGLWVGSGNTDGDAIEGTMANSALKLHNALTSAGIPHFYWNYGRPVDQGCDGGHNFGCWNFALNDAMPKIMAAFGSAPPPPPPPTGERVSDGDFEAAGLGPWICQSQCGADHGAGLAHGGTGNGWVRNTTGWNALTQTITVAANTSYLLSAWVRTSSNNTDGYVGLRTTGGTVLGETKFTSLGSYTQITRTVNSGSNTSLVVYAGLWANGDTWAQVDDVSVTPA